MIHWSTFKQKIIEILDKHVPSKTAHSSKHLPWLSNFIKHKMKERKKLYNRARQTQDVGDWDSYKIIKNHVNSIIKTAYNKYCSHLFDSSFSINRKRFWFLIKAMRKDTTGISFLKTGNTAQTSSEDKANALNTQFYSVFTKEDNEIPQIPSSTYPDIGTLIFNVDGIKVLLNTLQPKKIVRPR